MSEKKTEKISKGSVAHVKIPAKKELIAVVLVRGLLGIKSDIRDTLKMLRLLRKNCCVIIERTPSNLGMLNKAKDYITWGEIDELTIKMLIEKRAEKNPRDPKKTKPFFRLQPPRKGFGRKGIKFPFKDSGALGYRGNAMNDLIKRML